MAEHECYECGTPECDCGADFVEDCSSCWECQLESDDTPAGNTTRQDDEQE